MNLTNYDSHTITQMESDYLQFIKNLKNKKAFNYELETFAIMKDALDREVIDAFEFCTILNLNMFPDSYTDEGYYIEKYEDGTHTIVKTNYTVYDIMDRIFG